MTDRNIPSKDDPPAAGHAGWCLYRLDCERRVATARSCNCGKDVTLAEYVRRSMQWDWTELDADTLGQIQHSLRSALPNTPETPAPHCMNCHCGEAVQGMVARADYLDFHRALMSIVYESKSHDEAVRLASDGLQHRKKAEQQCTCRPLETNIPSLQGWRVTADGCPTHGTSDTQRAGDGKETGKRRASDGSEHDSNCGIFACDPCDCTHALKAAAPLASDEIRDLACCDKFVRESASEFCATCGYTNLDHLRKRAPKAK